MSCPVCGSFRINVDVVDDSQVCLDCGWDSDVDNEEEEEIDEED